MAWTTHGGRKLEELVSKTIKHLEIVSESIKVLLEMVNLLREDKADEAVKLFEDVNKLEHKADDLKREIMRELRMGFLHPLDREDILKLIITADDIAAYTKATARRIVILNRVGLKAPRKILDYLHDIIERSVNAAEILHKAINALTRNIDEALTLVDKVEEIEEEIDEIRMNALEELYKICKEKMTIDCILLKEIIDDAENISDKAEDTGDLLRIIVTTI
jgi:predicted phosphate transport protein (TIGR00153 family)